MNLSSHIIASLQASDAHMYDHNKERKSSADDSDSHSTGSSVDAVDISSTMYRLPADMFFSSPAELPVTKSAQDGGSTFAGEEE